MKQGAKVSWSKGIETIESLFSHHCGVMLGIKNKRYLKITILVQDGRVEGYAFISWKSTKITTNC